jgi:hypothetical protein
MKNQGIFNKGIYKQTPAHELGHGAFGLKHTFDPEYGVSDNPQITRALNLMGYNDQAHLAKFQWDIIHQHSGETAFDSTEEVMTRSNLTVMELINKFKQSYTGNVNIEINQRKNAIIFGENISLGNYKYASIAVKVLVDVDSTNVKTAGLSKSAHYLGNEQYYDIEMEKTSITLRSKKERDSLYNYITVPIDRIRWALDSVAKYIGITAYGQEIGALRTGSTTAALEHMDCTEFAARFLQLACGLTQVPSFSTAVLASVAESGGMYGNYLQFIIGSDAITFTDIQPGDIFLWRNNQGGHVGVVESYREPHVYILEALTNSCEASLNTGSCSNCVRHSTYTRTGNALFNHGQGDDWKGYFRPILNDK